MDKKSYIYHNSKRCYESAIYNIAANVDHEWSDQRVHASSSMIGTDSMYWAQIVCIVALGAYIGAQK